MLKKFEIEGLLADGIRHGFYTRQGGVSDGVYEGLNCGFGSDDAPEHVAQNRALVSADFGLPETALVTAYQHHSADVIVADEPWPREDAPRGDGIVTKVPGLALGVLTADCAPVLFVDPVAGVIGAAHAGWRGAFGGVLQNTVDAMVGLGAQRERVVAGVGPALGLQNFEVGDEFVETFLKANADFAGFFARPNESQKAHFDLAGFALFQLQSSGIQAAFTIERCTYEEDALFYSYRRNTHQGAMDYGRQISVIALV